MNFSDPQIWFVIIAIGIGSYLFRFSFIGLIGNRKLPDRVLRLLRYTPVAVLPGLVAPLVLWPASTGGQPDPARLLAAGAALLVGLKTKNVLASIGAGIAMLFLVSYLTGG